MAKTNSIRNLLGKDKIILLDGAMGTELQRRGFETRMPLWSANALIESPKLVQRVHEDYIRAGADIITTNTFRTQRSVFDKIGLGNKAKYYTELACNLAYQAATKTRKKILIAGSMAPLEDCYSPSLVPKNKLLYEIHKEHANALIYGKVDFILVETMNCIREAVIIAQILKELKQEFIISFVCNDKGLLSGESIKSAVDAIECYHPSAICLNCSSAKIIDVHISNLLKCSKFPVGAYANIGGIANEELGWKFSKNIDSKKYFDYAKKWINEGIQLIGSCCGSDPSYTKELRSLL